MGHSHNIHIYYPEPVGRAELWKALNVLHGQMQAALKGITIVSQQMSPYVIIAQVRYTPPVIPHTMASHTLV